MYCGNKDWVSRTKLRCVCGYVFCVAAATFSQEERFYRGIDRSCALWKEVCDYLIFILYKLVAALKHVCVSANQNVGFVSGPGKVVWCVHKA